MTARDRVRGSSELSEEILVERAAGGDMAAFEELVMRHADRLFASLRRFGLDDGEAQEVAQEKLRRKGTERPFTGGYLHTKDDGVYRCAACGTELFSSDTKFDSGTGWPSFTDPANRENVELHEDRSLFMRRTEVSCATCGGHLGHVFNDGPNGCDRYCINSVALKLDTDPAG